MTTPSDFDIRFSQMEDLPFLKEWFDSPSSCDPYPFEFENREEALKNWIGFSKYKASLTGTLKEVPCAVGTLFLMPYKKVAHHCSFYLIVSPEHRRKGIGTSMVRNLLHLAKTRFRLEGVHVEVYEPSPLLPLLQKLSFEPFAKQEGFVKIEGKVQPRVLLEYFFPQEGV